MTRALPLFVLATTACHAAPDPTPPAPRAQDRDREDAAVKEQRFVVFDTRAPLCREPRLDAAACVRQPPGVELARFEAIGRLLEDRGEWLGVETTDPWDVGQHCASDSNTILRSLGLRLRFFIARAALVPVTEAQTIAYPNRTGVTLRSGTPILAPEGSLAPLAARGLAVVDAGGFPLLLPRAEIHATETYVASAPFELVAQRTEIAGGRAMRYGTPLPATDFPADPENESVGTIIPEAPGVLRHPFHDTGVYGEAPHEGGVLVELRSACARLHVVVASDALVRRKDPRLWRRDRADFLLHKTRVPRASRWRVRAGATLFYPGGAIAGTAGGLTAPFDGDERSIDGRVCMARALFRAAPPAKATPDDAARASVTLCADKKDVALWPRFWSDADAAAIGPGARTYVVVEVENQSELDAQAVTGEVRAALRDSLLVTGAFAVAPPGQSLEEARAIAAARGAGVARVRVVVGSGEWKTPYGIFARRHVTATLTLADGSISQLPDLTGGSSPGSDNVAGGQPTPAFLREVFERAVAHTAAAIRTRLMAGERPDDLSNVTAVEELPAWAFPPGYSR